MVRTGRTYVPCELIGNGLADRLNAPESSAIMRPCRWIGCDSSWIFSRLTSLRLRLSFCVVSDSIGINGNKLFARKIPIVILALDGDAAGRTEFHMLHVNIDFLAS